MSYTKLAIELERKRLENLKKYIINNQPTYQKRGTLIETIGLEESEYQSDGSFKTIPYVMRYYKTEKQNFGIWFLQVMEVDSKTHDVYMEEIYDVVLHPSLRVMSEMYKIDEDFSNYYNETFPIVDKERIITYLHSKVVESNLNPTKNISYEEITTLGGKTTKQIVNYNSYSQSSSQVHNLANLDLIEDKINICSHDMVMIPEEIIEEFLTKQEVLEPRELSKINGFYEYNQKLKDRASFLDEGIVKVYNKK